MEVVDKEDKKIYKVDRKISKEDKKFDKEDKKEVNWKDDVMEKKEVNWNGDKWEKREVKPIVYDQIIRKPLQISTEPSPKQFQPPTQSSSLQTPQQPSFSTEKLQETNRLRLKIGLLEEEKKALWLQFRELQDENDALLKMNYELTQEKTALLTRLDEIRLSASAEKKSPYGLGLSSSFSEASKMVKLCEVFNLPVETPFNVLLSHAKDLVRAPPVNQYESPPSNFATSLKNSLIFSSFDLSEKLKKIEEIFSLFTIDPSDDFLVVFHEIHSDFVQMSQFLRVIINKHIQFP